MWEWFQGLTLLNWMTLIGFIILIIYLPFNTLNLFFNLFPRFKNWRATKSKVAFKKRIDELKLQIDRIAKYKKSPIDFLIEIIKSAIIPALFMLGSFGLFLMAFLETLYPSESPIRLLHFAAATMMVNLALVLLLIPCVFLLNLMWTIHQYQLPGLIFIEVANLLKEGQDKGFLESEHLSLIDTILEKDILDEPEKELLQNKWKENNVDNSQNLNKSAS